MYDNCVDDYTDYYSTHYLEETIDIFSEILLKHKKNQVTIEILLGCVNKEIEAKQTNKDEKQFSHYHSSILKTALKNFEDAQCVHMIPSDMTIDEFIRKWSAKELSEIIEVK